MYSGYWLASPMAVMTSSMNDVRQNCVQTQYTICCHRKLKGMRKRAGRKNEKNESKGEGKGRSLLHPSLRRPYVHGVQGRSPCYFLYFTRPSGGCGSSPPPFRCRAAPVLGQHPFHTDAPPGQRMVWGGSRFRRPSIAGASRRPSGRNRCH